MPAAVFEMPRTGTPSSCAIGSVVFAAFDSVGPRMMLTGLREMNCSKTAMPCFGSVASSSMASS